MIAKFALTAPALATVALLAGTPAVAATFYTDETAFLGATSGLTVEGFETATSAGATSVDFDGGSFSCSGSTWCPGFFGVSTHFRLDGLRSVFFATPDSATFVFDSAITAFGIWVGGMGDVAPITLTLSNSNGESGAVLTNHRGPYGVFGGEQVFAGLVDTDGFTSVTFSGDNRHDGIFFDRMYTGSALEQPSAIPLPAGLSLMLTALAALGLARRRDRRA